MGPLGLIIRATRGSIDLNTFTNLRIPSSLSLASEFHCNAGHTWNSSIKFSFSHSRDSNLGRLSVWRLGCFMSDHHRHFLCHKIWNIFENILFRWNWTGDVVRGLTVGCLGAFGWRALDGSFFDLQQNSQFVNFVQRGFNTGIVWYLNGQNLSPIAKWSGFKSHLNPRLFFTCGTQVL